MSVVQLGLDLGGLIRIDATVAAFAHCAGNLDLEPAERHALAFAWRGEQDHARMLAMGRAILQFAAPAGSRDQPPFLMVDADVRASLSRILREEPHLAGDIVSIDGITLPELDFGSCSRPASCRS